MSKGNVRITKQEFTRAGGLSNPDLFRKMYGGRWYYYRIVRNTI